MIGSASASQIDMTVSPTAVLSDGAHDVTVTASAAVLDAGIAQQTITQLFSRQRLQLGSAAGVVAPAGWSVTYTTDGMTFGAAPTDAAGWAAVRGVRAAGSLDSQGAINGMQVATHEAEIPTPPASAFTGSGSGDGWDVFFDDAGHVFNIYHHDGAGYAGGAIDCHMRTGGSCGPGWPIAILPLHSGMRTSGWVNNAHDRLWFPTNSRTGTGFACLDISDFASGPRWCGGSAAAALTVLGTTYPVPNGPNFISCNSSNPPSLLFGCAEGLAQYQGRVFTWEGLTGKILCLDTNAAGGAGAACAGQPYAFPSVTFATTMYIAANSGWRPELQISDGLLYGVGASTPPTFAPESLPANTYGVCLDPATLQTCTGWETPKSLPSAAVMLYSQPNAAGDIQGVCFKVPVISTASSPNASCYTPGGQTLTTNAGLASALVLATGQDGSAQRASFGAPITVGSRVYWGNAGWSTSAGALGCYDVATSASCPGFPVTTKNYVLVIDPANDNCLWKNSDDGTIGSFDTLGRAGCAIGPATAAFQAEAVVPRTACTGAGTVRAWRSLTMTSPATGFTAATVTVRTAAGAVVTSGGTTWSRVPITVNTPLDLAALAVADTGENPSFTLQLAGRTNTETVKAKLTAMGDAPQLCLTMRAQELCPTAAQFAPAPTSVTGSGQAVMTAGGTTTYTPTTVQVDMTAPASCPVTTPPVAPTPTPMGTVNKTSVPVAMPDYATTQKGVPVRLLTLANDAGSKGYAPVTTSVRMKDPTSGTWVTSLTIDGEGTYALDPPTGDIIFTPLMTFTGKAKPIAYRFEDTDGKFADSTLHVTVVVPPGPYANPDHVAGMRGQTLRLVPLYNDAHGGSSFEVSSLRLKHPKTGALVTTLKVRGEGTYTVSPTSGKVAFKPLKTFVGRATPQTYQITTIDSRTTTSTLHPVIRTTEPLLTIKTSSVRSRLAVGAQTTISARYCNVGGSTATKTSVRLPIPPAFTVVSPRGASVTTSVATWTIGDLKPGMCATKRLVVRAVSSGSGRFAGVITASNASRATDPAVVRVVGAAPPVTG